MMKASPWNTWALLGTLFFTLVVGTRPVPAAAFGVPAVPVAAAAPLPVGAVVMARAKAEPLFKAADEYSRYTLPWVERPTVVVMPQAWFDTEICGRSPCFVVGAFAPAESDRIYINADAPAWLVSVVVVHETVHWLQYRSGWPTDFSDCPQVAAHEAEAYVAGYLYALNNGVTQFSNRGFQMPDYSCEPRTPSQGK